MAACSNVELYTKRDGQPGVKCVFHIQNEEGQERAITATDNLTEWRAYVGTEVEVTYVHRVFPFQRKGMDWYGNDLYAVDIKIA